MNRRIPAQLALALACALPLQPSAQERATAAAGKAVYDKACALCHAAGVAGAPRFGNAGDWTRRLTGGSATLYRSALQGTPNGMPAKGGNLTLSDTEVKAAVDFIVSAAGGAARAASASTEKPRAAAARAAKPVPSAPAAPAAAPPAAVIAATARDHGESDPNAFNRLLTPPSARNLPPAQDGIHDPAGPGTMALQPPLTSFQALPRSNSGNRVDWVASLNQQQIQPRWDLNDSKAAPAVMDLNIVREVKGSMPDVVYPHKQHTEWLDCSNCHPAIFIPQKGANQISMASILLGQACGVCHGKVAFPVSECRLCHSRKKDDAARATVHNTTEPRK